MINIFKQRLVNIYKQIKNHKDSNKVWVSTDLGCRSNFNDVYLEILTELGLIEEVETYYDTGINYNSRIRVRGWRQIQNGSN